MTKVKNSNWDKTQKPKLDQISKTQMVREKNSKTQIMTKLKNSNCDQTQTLKLRQNSKNQIVTKLTNSNCDKTKEKFYCESNNSDISDSSSSDSSIRDIF